MEKEVVVFGLGNILMSDDGIGCYVIKYFLKYQDKYPNVEFIEVGTKAMTLLHLMANRKKAVFVDCALMSLKAGTIKRFTPDDAESVKQLAHYSLHEADVLKIISMSRELGQCPDEIVFFGIEPKILSPGQKLSRILSSKLNHYATAIHHELTDY